MPDSLGSRMKAYETPYKALLPRRTYTVIRIDGRCFHTFLKGAQKPFDPGFAHAMDWTTRFLCEEIDGAVFGYTQSDEISIVMTDFATRGTQPWFNGEVQKITSVAASLATTFFNRCFDSMEVGTGMATFDARVFTIPQQIEVANYLIWRQQDAMRNAVSMAARAHFSHKQCQSKNGAQLQEMLFQEKGINFNDYPVRFKRGGMAVKRERVKEKTFFDGGLKQQVTRKFVRSVWEMEDAERFTVVDGGLLAQSIPTYDTMIGNP